MPHEPTVELDVRFSGPGAEPTPWGAVRQVIEEAELFWISTVRADGRPHVTLLPAVWLDERIHFCTGPREQKAGNLDANPRCALTTGTNRWKEGLDVVIEGVARRVVDEVRLHLLAGLWETKYAGDWRFGVADAAFRQDDGSVAHVFEVTPEKILAFAKGEFAQTRYRF